MMPYEGPRRIAGVLRWRFWSLRGRADAAAPCRFDGLPKLQGYRGGRVRLGSRVRIYSGVLFLFESDRARISVGSRSFINRRTEIVCRESVTIGEECAISWDVVITDTDNHSIDGRTATAPVVIGDRVWIGAQAMILKGVTVGPGAVVAARSVVTRDVPPRALVAGQPARILKEDVTWTM